MDYLEYYELDQEPFSVMPVSKFYFHSRQHDRAMEKLQFAIATEKGLAVVVGHIGTGKTMLARRLLDNLPESEFEAALLVIIHSDVEEGWLLSRIAVQLGVEEPEADRAKLLHQLLHRLEAISEGGKKAVVLIDEAQMLRKRELMEEFRGLLNLELPDRKLLSFVFFGLPELEECLRNDPPLSQRVAVKHTLQPFDRDTTGNYIHHRVTLAGGKKPLFNTEAVDAVHYFSDGIPRVINVICDNALFEGYVRKNPTIGVDIIESVAVDLGLMKEEKG